MANKVYIYNQYWKKNHWVLESSIKEVKYQKYYKIQEEKATTI